jgi:hypothetical protein
VASGDGDLSVLPSLSVFSLRISTGSPSGVSVRASTRSVASLDPRNIPRERPGQRRLVTHGRGRDRRHPSRDLKRRSRLVTREVAHTLAVQVLHPGVDGGVQYGGAMECAMGEVMAFQVSPSRGNAFVADLLNDRRLLRIRGILPPRATCVELPACLLLSLVTGMADPVRRSGVELSGTAIWPLATPCCPD